ncbi:acyl-CoA mutase large subunit family protein [Pelagicoccus sp. NFK12]|uniref:Acyl-CoA mutase large subunit family protein n=1 Tax=Pelagicoccus enzymogenes TaxID=2773457 RepID=A0A927F9F6_9BACT|nr:methylmalonyl-CoA mutase family protein [Pelagicoccus enzymogenes]MBD5780289.1 acyl-CoA mutase large subunit family protein [Pelagicoccus enzymogenes]
MSTETNEDLLKDFKQATYEEWRAAAEALLKGAPFEKRMLTKTPEGIVLQPIYRQEDVAERVTSTEAPGEGNFARGANPSGYLGSPWEIAQEQPYGDPQVFNEALLKDLNAGQSAVNALLDSASQLGLDPDQATDAQVGECGLSLSTLDDLKVALNGVKAGYLPVYFQSGCAGLSTQALFNAWLKEQGLDTAQVKGGLNMDPYGVLAARGKLPASLDALLDELALLVRHNAQNAPDFSAAGISGIPYHGAGASATEELASVLSTGVAYLRAMDARGISVDEAAGQLRFTLSIGGNFFMEIAKFKVARMLWARVVKELGGGPEACRMKIHARTGMANKTQLDPYVNMLRTTTEAFSAVVGGASSICVGCFDETVRLPDDFSRRLARNLQVILQEECELTHVIDPAGGSWYIDSLTDELAKKAWAAFQNLEKEGGIVASLKSGKWQETLAATRASRESMLGQRRASLIGTNQYPNLEEKPLEARVVTNPAFKDKARNAAKSRRQENDCAAVRKAYEDTPEGEKIVFLIDAIAKGATVGCVTKLFRSDAVEEILDTPLPSWRLAQRYEALRAAAAKYKEKTGTAPQIFLANLGPLKKHKIRADFTRSFFAAGGFECIYGSGIEDVDTGVKDFIRSGARIAVMCGTDPDYVEKVPELASALKKAAPDMTLLLAGFPGDNLATFKEAGLDDYIFVKSNNYEVNKAHLEWLGVL